MPPCKTGGIHCPKVTTSIRTIAKFLHHHHHRRRRRRSVLSVLHMQLEHWLDGRIHARMLTLPPCLVAATTCLLPTVAVAASNQMHFLYAELFRTRWLWGARYSPASVGRRMLCHTKFALRPNKKMSVVTGAASSQHPSAIVRFEFSLRLLSFEFVSCLSVSSRLPGAWNACSEYVCQRVLWWSHNLNASLG